VSGAILSVHLVLSVNMQKIDVLTYLYACHHMTAQGAQGMFLLTPYGSIRAEWVNPLPDIQFFLTLT